MIFFDIYEISVAKGTGTNMYNIFSCKYRMYFCSPEVRIDSDFCQNENCNIKVKYQSISQLDIYFKAFANGINYIQGSDNE